MALPGAPNIQSNPQAAINSLSFFWQEPTTTGTSPITNYVLLNQNTSVSTIIGPSTYSIQISSLTNTTDYNFQLAAVNASGQGPYINFMTAQPGTLAAGVTNVNTQVAGINAIAVTWNYLTNPNESRAEGFVVTTTASTVNFSSIQSFAYGNQSSIFISNLPINTTSTTYTAIVQVINDAGWSVPITSNSVTGTRTLELWLDGNDIDYSGVSPRDGSRITRWIDKSGNGRHAISPSGNPIIRASNQKNLLAAFFNGSSNLTVTYTSFPTSYTVFIVQQLTVNNASYQRAFDNNGYLFVGVNGPNVATFTGNGGWADVLTNTPNVNNFQAWCLLSMTVTNTTLIPYVNGTAQNSKTTNNAVFNNLFIGGSTQQWNGYIGEILIYSIVLGTRRRQEVEGYLANKWNLQNNLPIAHPYYAANPTSVMLPWIPGPAVIVPVIMSFTNVTGTSFTVTWTGGTYASSYTFTLAGNSATPSTLTNNTATFSDLAANTAYLVIITATNGTGSLSSTGVSVTTGPTQPSSLTSSNVTQNAFTVNWSTVTGAISYTYTLNGVQVTSTTSTSTSATFTNQLVGTNYTLVVTANSASGSTPSIPIVVTTLGPSQPTSPQVIGITTTGFTLSWSGGSGATSYNYLLNNIPTIPSTDNGVSANAAIFTTLNSGSNFTIVIQAIVDTYTNSSPPITTRTLGPSNPYNLWQTNSSATGFTINWLGGFGATSYTYTINGNSVTPAVNNGVEQSSAVITGLTIGNVYSVVVRATNAAGNADSISTNFYTIPTIPTSVSSSAVTGNQFTVSWSGGSVATSYRYTLNGQAVIPSTDNGIASKNAIFSDLNGGTIYNVIVTAVNPAGSAASSYVSRINPLSVSGNAQWFDATDPLNNGSQPASGTTITTWYDKSGNGRNLSQYSSYALPTLTTNKINSLPAVNFTNSSGLYTPTSFAKSSNVTVLWVGIIMSTANNWGTLWGHFVNHDNDIQIRRLTNTMQINWHTNNDNTNLLLTATSGIPVMYSCTMSGGTNMFFQQTTVGGTTTTSFVEGLTWSAGNASVYVGVSESGELIQSFASEILYYQSVLSTENRQLLEGYLAWKWGLQTQLPTNHPYYSLIPSATVQPTQVTTAGPTAPTSLGQQATTTTGFTVTWSNGTGATSYNYYINSVLTTPATDNGISANNAVFTGLTLASQYTVIVQAINTNGTSNSNSIRLFTQPNQPTNLSSSNVSTTSFTITWTAITGLTNLVYTLNGQTTTPSSSTTTSAIFTGLLTNVSYTVIITNINGSISNPSAPLVVTTVNTLPFTAQTYLPLSTNTTDLGVNPKTVTTNGTVTFGTVGSKQGASFPNSVNSYLSIPYTLATNLTLAFWYYANDGGGYTFASITTPSFNPALQFDKTAASTVTLYTQFPGQWTISPSTSDNGSGAWNFITVTLNQTTYLEQVYMNGNFVTSATGTGGFPVAANLFFLGRSGDNNRAFSGYIRQFMFFNSILTAPQISSLYTLTA